MVSAADPLKLGLGEAIAFAPHSLSRWVGHKELAERVNKHRMEETETSITGKLARGTFAVSFFLAVLEMEGVRLEDL
jgi:Domain of unknown function (DUF6471)